MRIRTAALRLLALLTAATSWGCAISTPFRGPGVDDGNLQANQLDPNRTVFVALTGATLDRSKREPFDRATDGVMDQMEQVPGLVGFSFRFELLGSKVWTMSVWEDEASMRRFVRSAIHRDARRAGKPASLEFRFHSFETAANQVPISWSRALKLLQDHGE